MPAFNAYDAELQLNTLLLRGRWEQALARIDAWIVTEPARADLWLRKAQLFLALHRAEQGLLAIRQYRALQPDAAGVTFLEVECLLESGHPGEALTLLDGLPASERTSAQGMYFRGRVCLARNEVPAALRHFWAAYQHEPGFNRALLEWAALAMRYLGKWWVRRQLSALQARQQDNPTIAVSVGLALNMMDSRYGQRFLRRAVERYNDFVPTIARPPRSKSATMVEGTKGAGGEADAFCAVNEQLLAGHFGVALDAYYKAVARDPSWMPVLAPLVAEGLVNELVRPEEARLLLEDALRKEPTDYRLHLSYTKVFLHLGFGEEALSSANCALALAPETDRAIALVQRACAHLLLKERERAREDLERAVAQMPEARDLIRQEPSLRLLLHDRRLNRMLAEQPNLHLWGQVKRWLLGEG
jgi:tetratricopeptide (TPR) repeat protein